MSAVGSVHDNVILSYTVDGRNRQVTLHTVFSEREAHTYTDVIFSEVFVYHFEGDTFGTILFDIQEAPLLEVYATYAEVFIRRKQHGWPELEYGTEHELADKLRSRGARSWLVTSSYGMDGFVIARSVQIVPGHG